MTHTYNPNHAEGRLRGSQSEVSYRGKCKTLSEKHPKAKRSGGVVQM
jgi:hypothetical protein